MCVARWHQFPTPCTSKHNSHIQGFGRFTRLRVARIDRGRGNRSALPGGRKDKTLGKNPWKSLLIFFSKRGATGSFKTRFAHARRTMCLIIHCWSKRKGRGRLDSCGGQSHSTMCSNPWEPCLVRRGLKFDVSWELWQRLVNRSATQMEPQPTKPNAHGYQAVSAFLGCASRHWPRLPFHPCCRSTQDSTVTSVAS